MVTGGVTDQRSSGTRPSSKVRSVIQFKLRQIFLNEFASIWNILYASTVTKIYIWIY